MVAINRQSWRDGVGESNPLAPSASPEAPHVPEVVRSVRDRFRLQLKTLFSDLDDGPEEEVEARKFLVSYLIDNIETAATMHELRELISEFRLMAPRMFVIKCIDGRVHGNKGKGYPPMTVSFFRSEGSRLDTDASNREFWRRINSLVLDAERTSDDVPALFIALAHTATEGGGCAAQSIGVTDPEEVIRNSLATVKGHAEAVRTKYTKDQVFAIHGMSNTDDMSETLIFENGTELSSSKIIEKLKLGSPREIFNSTGLNTPIRDASVKKYLPEDINTLDGLLDEDNPLMFNDLQTSVAMEVYLLRQIKIGNFGMFNRELVTEIHRTLHAAGNVPATLMQPLLFQTLWNIAYTLYQRKRNLKLTEDERDKKLKHAEKLVCYGEGFELLPRNTIVLAKTGRGKDGHDKEALEVAIGVLQQNRQKFKDKGLEQKHKPIVHVNVEVKGDIITRNQFVYEVLEKLKEMTDEARGIFTAAGIEVELMTTYSYDSEKKFYPVSVYSTPITQQRHPNQRSSMPVDLALGLDDDPDSFVQILKEREQEYTGKFASVALAS